MPREVHRSQQVHVPQNVQTAATQKSAWNGHTITVLTGGALLALAAIIAIATAIFKAVRGSETPKQESKQPVNTKPPTEFKAPQTDRAGPLESRSMKQIGEDYRVQTLQNAEKELNSKQDTLNKAKAELASVGTDLNKFKDELQKINGRDTSVIKPLEDSIRQTFQSRHRQLTDDQIKQFVENSIESKLVAFQSQISITQNAFDSLKKNVDSKQSEVDELQKKIADLQ